MGGWPVPSVPAQLEAGATATEASPCGGHCPSTGPAGQAGAQAIQAPRPPGLRALCAVPAS